MLSERRLLILPNVLVLQIHVYVGKSLPEIIVVDELLHLNLIISKLPISAVARQNKLFLVRKCSATSTKVLTLDINWTIVKQQFCKCMTLQCTAPPNLLKITTLRGYLGIIVTNISKLLKLCFTIYENATCC